MIEHKQGATFFAEVEYVPDADAPATVADTTITSQIRTKTNVLLSTCVIVKSLDNLAFSCTVTDTTEWPIGLIYWDIKFVNDSIITFSETEEILVQRSYTA